MTTIDYIYRFDPTNPSAKPLPNDADSARRTLEDGNRTFSRWMESCRGARHRWLPGGPSWRFAHGILVVS
jgi:hypothetical protein